MATTQTVPVKEQDIKEEEDIIVVNALSATLDEFHFLRNARAEWEGNNEKFEEEITKNNIFETQQFFENPILRERFELYIVEKCGAYFHDVSDMKIRIRQSSAHKIHVDLIEDNINHLQIKSRRDPFTKLVLIPESLGLRKKYLFLSKNPARKMRMNAYNLTPHIATKLGCEIVHYGVAERRTVKLLGLQHDLMLGYYAKLHKSKMMMQVAVYRDDSELTEFEKLLEEEIFGEHKATYFVETDKKLRLNLEQRAIQNHIRFDMPYMEDKKYDTSDFTVKDKEFLRRVEKQARRQASHPNIQLNKDEEEEEEE